MCPLFTFWKKMKHWNVDVNGYWVIGAGYQIEKDLEPIPPNFSKDLGKSLLLFISINWPSLVTKWDVVQKIYSEMHLVLCINSDHGFTDFVNHEMVKNTKTWIPWEWNITFLRNKKILNLCLIWHILRSYRFVAEVTFKGTIKWIGGWPLYQHSYLYR